MRQAICFVIQFADNRHIKTRSARVSLIFCPICRDCHIKNQYARAFLGFGASFYRCAPQRLRVISPPHARLFAIFRWARKPTKRYVRLLDCFTTSNHQSLFFSLSFCSFNFSLFGFLQYSFRICFLDKLKAIFNYSIIVYSFYYICAR